MAWTRYNHWESGRAKPLSLTVVRLAVSAHQTVRERVVCRLVAELYQREFAQPHDVPQSLVLATWLVPPKQAVELGARGNPAFPAAPTRPRT